MTSRVRALPAAPRTGFPVSQVRLILVALICISPAMLHFHGLMIQGLIAGIVAVLLATTAYSLRPHETDFVISNVRLIAALAAVPAVWMIVQVLPLRSLAHPIWRSAETAAGSPIAGAISIDPGASIVALGRYLSLTALTFISGAVAVDRQRAEWILFALTAAGTPPHLLCCSLCSMHPVKGGETPPERTP